MWTRLREDLIIGKKWGVYLRGVVRSVGGGSGLTGGAAVVLPMLGWEARVGYQMLGSMATSPSPHEEDCSMKDREKDAKFNTSGS